MVPRSEAGCYRAMVARMEATTLCCQRVSTGAVARRSASVEGLPELDGSWTGSEVAACYLLPPCC